MNIFTSGRIDREKATIGYMIEIYCSVSHGGEKGASKLCGACEELLAYARARLDNCVYNAAKPACSKCRIHCYKKDMRDRIKEVMRVSGPRMMLYHPLLSLMHLFDTFKGNKNVV